MTSLFDVKAALPSATPSITMFATRRTGDDREQRLAARARDLSKVFRVTGKATDMGDTVTIASKRRTLTLYPASDSFWYHDEQLFANEDRKHSKTLPDAKAARELATRFLAENWLLPSFAYVHSTSFTSVAIRKDGARKAEEFRTEIHVNFRYKLDGLPVFGPGAKSRVSFVDAKTRSGVFQFWRSPQQLEEPRPLMSPSLAIELFSRNFRFAKLKRDTAKGTISGVELGYFAMSPTAVQNYLIPVYQVVGTIRTDALPRYDFKHYVVAVKYSDADVKAMGINIGNVKSVVF